MRVHAVVEGAEIPEVREELFAEHDLKAKCPLGTERHRAGHRAAVGRTL